MVGKYNLINTYPDDHILDRILLSPASGQMWSVALIHSDLRVNFGPFFSFLISYMYMYMTLCICNLITTQSCFIIMIIIIIIFIVKYMIYIHLKFFTHMARGRRQCRAPGREFKCLSQEHTAKENGENAHRTVDLTV